MKYEVTIGTTQPEIIEADAFQILRDTEFIFFKKVDKDVIPTHFRSKVTKISPIVEPSAPTEPSA